MTSHFLRNRSEFNLMMTMVMMTCVHEQPLTMIILMAFCSLRWRHFLLLLVAWRKNVTSHSRSAIDLYISCTCVARRSSPLRREKRTAKPRKRVGEAKWAARGMVRREGKGTPALKPNFFEVYYSYLRPPEAAHFYLLKHNYSYNLVKLQKHVIDFPSRLDLWSSIIKKSELKMKMVIIPFKKTTALRWRIWTIAESNARVSRRPGAWSPKKRFWWSFK